MTTRDLELYAIWAISAMGAAAACLAWWLMYG
jgi:hypothetical protein